ncbi:hypothetical protein QCN27_19295 [Cereibacter sp. SYSU M97828]|nr:hypothetical protein [Cereibacter flavus]
MFQNDDHCDDQEEALDLLRIGNLKGMLDHLQGYPADDAECLFELKLPLSVLTKLMLRSAESRSSPQRLIVEALEGSGFAPAH